MVILTENARCFNDPFFSILQTDSEVLTKDFSKEDMGCAGVQRGMSRLSA